MAIFGCELIRTGIRSAPCIIVLFRIGSNYFLLVRCHFRIRSATTAGQYDCFEMFKTFAGVLRMEAYSYYIVSIRVNSYQFVSIPISSLCIPINSLRIRTGPCCFPVENPESTTENVWILWFLHSSWTDTDDRYKYRWYLYSRDSLYWCLLDLKLFSLVRTDSYWFVLVRTGLY